MKSPKIGIDSVEISRFKKLLQEGKNQFIKNTFSVLEQEYCNSHKDSATHYAGTFAAKEAVRKLSAKFHLPFNELEVRHLKGGMPVMYIKGKRDQSVSISITHTSSLASAVAIQ